MRSSRNQSDAIPLLRNRDFNRLWVGQTAAELGTTCTNFALPLVVAALSGSTWVAGLVGTSVAVCTLVFRLPAGAVADRFDRRRLLMAGSVVRLAAAAVLAGLVLTGSGALVVPIAAVAVVLALAETVTAPAQISALPQIVPEEQLPAAFSANEARTHTATLVGPPIGGLLYGLGRAWPFALDVVIAAVAIVSLSRIRADLRPSPLSTSRPNLLRDVIEGVRLDAREPILRACLAVSAPLNLALIGALLATTLILQQEGQNGSAIGLASAGFGVGGILGALASPALQRRLDLAALTLAITVALTLALLGSALVAGSLLMALPLAVGGFLAPALNTAVFSTIARITPAQQQGRVISTVIVGSGTVAAGAPALVGALLQAFAPAITLLVLAAIMAVCVLSALVNQRHLHRGAQNRPRREARRAGRTPPST